MPEEYQLHIYGSGTLEDFVKRSTINKRNIIFYGFQSHAVVFDDLKMRLE